MAKTHKPEVRFLVGATDWDSSLAPRLACAITHRAHSILYGLEHRSETKTASSNTAGFLGETLMATIISPNHRSANGDGSTRHLPAAEPVPEPKGGDHSL
jgi:hypothetical protein